MTVLQRQTAGGVGSQRTRKYMVAFLMAVVGVGAAYGLSQVINDRETASTAEATLQARVESGQAQSAAMKEAAQLQSRVEAGRAQSAAIGAAAQANVWTLEDELAAIHQSRHVVPAKPFERVWTLEDELAAIHQSRHDLNTVRGSVGSAAIAEHANALEWELEQIKGVGTTTNEAESAVRNRNFNPQIR